MKFQKITFSLFILLLVTNSPLKASHDIGGEIWWECLGNGKFVFHANLYRDCNGVSHWYKSKALEIYGNPLPTGSNNSLISSINLMPDSALWLSQNRGDISPDCNDVGGMIVSCSSADQGAYQSFPYKSNPIYLNGTPPTNGWRFSLEPPCCRPNLINLASQGQSILSAIMYPNGNNDPVDNCYNSSPKFAENPNYYSCTGTMKYANQAVMDAENDSVIYSFYRTYNTPASSPTVIGFGFFNDFNRPTPPASLDSASVGAKLDSLSGMLSYKIGPNYSRESFWVVIRADEYREGTRISSIFREYPIFVNECVDRNISAAKPNVGVYVRVDGQGYYKNISQNSNTIKVKTGQQVNLSLSANFIDSTNNYTLNSYYTNTDFEISSPQFSSSENDTSLCASPPCAEFIMNNQGQTSFDSLRQAYVGTGHAYLGSINWEPECLHLEAAGESKVYQFNLITDIESQLCDTLITAVNNQTINIEVSNDSSLFKPNLHCVDMQSYNNKIGVTWDTIGVSKDSFLYWSIYSSRSNGQFQLLDTIQDHFIGQGFSGYGPSGQYQTNFFKVDRLDTTYDPSIYIGVNTLNCNFDIPNQNSDTLSKYVSLIQEGNELVVNVSASPGAGDYTYSLEKCNPQTGPDSNIQFIASIDSTVRFIPPDTGYYSVRVIPLKYCRGRSDCFYFKEPNSLSEGSFEKRLKVYPNPSNGLVNLENYGKERLQLKIYNVQGKLMQEKVIEGASKQLQIDGEEGLYFFTLTNESGEQATFKIVKQ